MKSLIFLLVLVSGFAYGSEIKLYESELSLWAQVVKGEFAVNPAMGRAWVVVSTAERHHGGRGLSSSGTFRNEKVPGLSFDSATSKIMLDHEGQQLECGHQTGRGIFKRIKETNCHFESRKVWRDIDNGYYTYRTQFLQLFLVTK